MVRWVMWAWWNLMIISNESMNFKDPKELDDPQLSDDPQLFHDQLEVWTLIIQKPTVIPPSLMVLLNLFIGPTFDRLADFLSGEIERLLSLSLVKIVFLTSIS